MVNITINNQKISVKENTSILDAAKEIGIEIPTLCYLKDICEIGACRICVVEIDGDKSSLSAACNTSVADGMSVRTNSKRVREARRINVELLLSEHNVSCTSCVRGGNCTLQTLAEDLNVLDVPYDLQINESSWSKDCAVIRDESKCVKCMRCIGVCKDMQTLGVWDTHQAGGRISVGVTDGLSIKESDCVICGQCITHCPVGALYARDDTEKVLDALSDPEKTVVVQIAPAVRAAWGEGLGLSREEATVGRMVAAVRKLGADYIFDTNFTADLTVMEEANELLERVSKKDKHLPMFTSCCPGWVRFVNKQYPEMAQNLSTAKSPQQMFGAVTKSWFAKRTELDPANIFCVSIMPCVAKKEEATADNNVDAVLTSRELIRLIKSHHVNVKKLEDEAFDDPLGESTGAAVIFGTTGGVMEAALRSAYYFATKRNPDPDMFKAVRGDGIREATVDINGTQVRAAVASGLKNARALLEKIKSGEASYDFVEIMACPGGCVGGGGQPIIDDGETALTQAAERTQMLYALDKKCANRFSHENPVIVKAYEEFFEKPLSPVSHQYLHVKHVK